MDSSCTLPLDGRITTFRRGVKLRSTVNCLPACLTTPQHRSAQALAMFLHQPKSHAKLAPVCGKPCGSMKIKQADSLLTLPDNLLLRLSKSSLQLITPEEGNLWAKKLAEGEHHLRYGKGIRDLIHGSKPAANICERFRAGETANIVQELRGWLQAILGEEEAKIAHLLFSKLEFGTVEYNTPSTAPVQEGACGKEVGLYILAPEDAVINTFQVFGKISNDFI
jgi:hypothetical protein